MGEVVSKKIWIEYCYDRLIIKGSELLSGVVICEAKYNIPQLEPKGGAVSIPVIGHLEELFHVDDIKPNDMLFDGDFIINKGDYLVSLVSGKIFGIRDISGLFSGEQPIYVFRRSRVEKILSKLSSQRLLVFCNYQFWGNKGVPGNLLYHRG